MNLMSASHHERERREYHSLYLGRGLACVSWTRVHHPTCPAEISTEYKPRLTEYLRNLIG